MRPSYDLFIFCTNLFAWHELLRTNKIIIKRRKACKIDKLRDFSFWWGRKWSRYAKNSCFRPSCGKNSKYNTLVTQLPFLFSITCIWTWWIIYSSFFFFYSAKFEASILEGFLSLFANQSRLLAEIYNYTSIIPDLELVLRGINLSQTVTQKALPEQDKNVTQNCTKEKDSAVVAPSAPSAPACPLGNYAPGKVLNF